MKLYDTLSKKKRELDANKKLRLFVCGPTVYDHSHIGHARTYIVFDTFVKYLRHKQYDVFYLQNITDIDDRIIRRAREENISVQEVAQKYEKEYMEDMAALGVTSVDKYARATDYIPEIFKQIKLLLKKGYAYEITGDGIYYDILKFEGYGKLSGRTAVEAEDAVSRIDESDQKKNKGDFALWKFKKTEDEPSWDSPWGPGRPGWHIEDTAITHKEFDSPQYELHGGARDLIFPHHEAEISQMEAAYGVSPMVEHWMHTGFLQVRNEKMSKSLKNFVTIQEILKNHSPSTLRMFFTTKLYRSPIDYDETGLKEAQANEKRLTEFWRRVANGKWKTTNGNKKYKDYIESFWRELENDFNTPRAFAELFQLVTYANTHMDKNEFDREDAQKIADFLKEMNAIFGVVDEAKISTEEKIPADVQKLVEQREQFRTEKKWDESDKIRGEIAQKGYEVKDTDEGPRISKG